MKSQEPSSSAEADLQRLLQQLGQQGAAPTRDAQQEIAREARMAAGMDAELEQLVGARRFRRRALFGVASAAALVALTLGVQSALRSSAGPLAISPEQITDSPRSNRHDPEPAPPVVATPIPRASVALRSSAVGPPPALQPPPLPSALEPQSTLAEENQLFKDAAESARNGDVDGAVARLDTLLADHPASPLAQTALVRKFRLLAKSGRSDEARREAEHYLAAYPSGFAVSEARALQAPAAGSEAPR